MGGRWVGGLAGPTVGHSVTARGTNEQNLISEISQKHTKIHFALVLGPADSMGIDRLREFVKVTSS